MQQHPKKKSVLPKLRETYFFWSIFVPRKVHRATRRRIPDAWRGKVLGPSRKLTYPKEAKLPKCVGDMWSFEITLLSSSQGLQGIIPPSGPTSSGQSSTSSMSLFSSSSASKVEKKGRRGPNKPLGSSFFYTPSALSDNIMLDLNMCRFLPVSVSRLAHLSCQKLLPSQTLWGFDVLTFETTHPYMCQCVNPLYWGWSSHLW